MSKAKGIPIVVLQSKNIEALCKVLGITEKEYWSFRKMKLNLK